MDRLCRSRGGGKAPYRSIDLAIIALAHGRNGGDSGGPHHACGRTSPEIAPSCTWPVVNRGSSSPTDDVHGSCERQIASGRRSGSGGGGSDGARRGSGS